MRTAGPAIFGASCTFWSKGLASLESDGTSSWYHIKIYKMSDGRSRSGDERALAHQSRHWAPRVRAAQHRPCINSNNDAADTSGSFDSPDGVMQNIPILQLGAAQQNNNTNRNNLFTPVPQQLFPATPTTVALSLVTQPINLSATQPVTQPAIQPVNQQATQPLFGF